MIIFRLCLLVFLVCHTGMVASVELFSTELNLPNLGPKSPDEELIDYRERMQTTLGALDQKYQELENRLLDERASFTSRLRSAETPEEKARAKRLLGYNLQQERQLRRAVSQRRRAIQRAFDRESKKNHLTQYYNCSNTTEQFSIEDTTEASFCLECDTYSEQIALNQAQIQQTQENLQWEDFKEQLRTRVAGEVLARISHIRFLRACASNDTQKIKDWLKNLAHLKKAKTPLAQTPKEPKNDSTLTSVALNAQSRDIQELCRRRIEPIENSVSEMWSDMRASLALSQSEDAMISSARFRSGAIGSEFMDTTPSHKFWDFGELPPLSREEIQEATARYADYLSKNVELEKLTPEELKQKIVSGEIRPQMFMVNNRLSAESLFQNTNLTLQDRDSLRKAVQELAEKNRQEYFDIMAEQPLLAWIKNQNPGSQELDSALGEMESRLIDLVEKLENKEDLPDKLLLSFEPLVENLLAQTAPDPHTNSPYCPAVEKARARIEEEESSKENQLFALEMALITPCFAPAKLKGTNFLSCLFVGGGFLSFNVFKSARATDDSLNQVILRNKMFDHLGDAFFEDAEDDTDKMETRQDIFTQLQENESQFNQDLMMFLPLLALEFIGAGKAIKVLRKTFVEPAIKRVVRKRQEAQLPVND